MPDPITGLVAGGIGNGLIQNRSANKAADAQTQAAQMSVDEQRAAREEARKIMQPFVDAGMGAMGRLGQYEGAGEKGLAGMLGLAGLSGADAQQQAIAGLQNSPEMQAMLSQGSNLMLQNASATGGLRGGNTQAAMGQFGPQLLAGLIDKQYGRLGGLTQMGLNTTQNIAQMGQASAAGTAANGLASAQGIAGQYGNMGAAQAGMHLAQGKALGGLANLPFQAMMMQQYMNPRVPPSTLGDGFYSNPFGGY
jgi:hypothetical protein